MLSIAPGLIPDSILSQTTGTTQTPLLQTAFAPGVSTLSSLSASGKAGTQATYYEFSVARSTGLPAPVSFSTQVGSKLPAVDMALALYDTDGNLLRVADADTPSAVSGIERLVATLESSRPYVLGVFSRNDNPASQGGDPITVTVDTGEQRVGSTITVDASTGKRSFSGVAAADRLQGAGDVDYFPLELTNLGQSATITLQPNAGSGMQLYGEIYRREIGRGPWVPVASAASVTAGGGVTLQPQPAPDVNLTDSEFLLAVAAKGLEPPAQGYKVSIDGSQSLLVPATVSTSGAPDLGACLPSTAGVAAATFTGSKSLPSTFMVRATVNGKLRLNVDPSFSFKPVLSVYDATGKKLLAVASRRSDGPLDLVLDAKAGRQYVVRVATTSNKASATFTLTASQTYVPTELAATAVVTSTNASLGPLSLDPTSGGTFLRIFPAINADILVLRLAANPGATASPQMWVLAPSVPQGPPVAVPKVAGPKTIDYAIDLTQTTGPFDLFVNGVGKPGVGGTAELSYGMATLPRSLSAAAFAAATIDLQSASLTTASSKQSVAFGKLANQTAFCELSPGATETMSTAAAGPAAVLEYVRKGNTFELKDWSMRTDGAPKLSGFVPGKQVVGVAAMSLSLGGAAGLGVTVSSDKKPRTGVGVAMVPDLKSELKTQFQSLLQIRNQFLQFPEQRDLWETLLPANLAANKPAQVQLSPTSQKSPLRAKVSVLDAADKVLASGTSQAGQPLSFSLTPQMLKAGGTVRFLVEPLAGSPLGDGGYDLVLSVQTNDPRPFEMTESKLYSTQATPADWSNSKLYTKGDRSLPNGYGFPAEGLLPSTLTVQPVPAFGVINGKIESSTSVYAKPTGTAGAIDLYSFKLPVDAQGKPAPQPFEIYTTELAGSTVDTTIGLYIKKQQTVANTTTIWYEQVDEVAPGRDYYPSDRTTIDSKIVVNNPGYLYDLFLRPQAVANGYTLFVAVKGQFGTQGDYTLHVASVTPERVGPALPPPVPPPISATLVDPISGTATVATGGGFGFSTPSTFVGGSSITTTFKGASLQKTGQFLIDVYDSEGGLLFTQQAFASSPTVTVPLGDPGHPFQPSSRYVVQMRQQLGLVWTGTDLTASVSPGAPLPVAAAIFWQRGTSSPAHDQTLSPAPDGHATGTLKATSGISSTTFYAEADGTATFSIDAAAATGGTWALYRLFVTGAATEYDHIDRQLVDFVRVSGGTTSTFTDYLARGSYELRFSGTSGATTGTYDVQLPAFDAIDIPVDPNTGNNVPKPLRYAEPTVADSIGGLNSLTSQYFHVMAPADAAKNWSLSLFFQQPYAQDKDGTNLKYINALEMTTATKSTLSLYKRNVFAAAGVQENAYTPVDFTLDGTPLSEVDSSGGTSQVVYAGFRVTIDDTPLPGDEYFLGHHQFLGDAVYRLAPRFVVPQSGDPDLVASQISLSPDSGRTFVDVEVRNDGFGSSADFAGTMQISNYGQDATSKLSFQSLGGNAATHFVFDWNPDDPTDFISMLVNTPNPVPELRGDNNFKKKALQEVDANRPTASIALADAAMDGEQGGVWGRYLSGVYGVPIDFAVTGSDVDGDYF